MPIETDRLRLRRFRESDADAVHIYGSDPEVCQFTDFGPNSWGDTVNYVEHARSHPVDSLADLAITMRGSDRVIGGCGAHDPRGEEPDERPHVRELGWILRRDLWGQGFATEAVAGLIDHLAREHPRITRLEARCRPQNSRSARVMEKAGMTFEWLLERDYECKGAWVDSHLYALDLRELRKTSSA